MFSFFSNAVPQITSQELKELMDTKEQFTLLDVRTPEEYKESHIKGSILFPLDQLVNDIEKKFPNKEQKLYVHCRSGSRSSQAVEYLISKEYKNVYNVTGGIMQWQNLGYPVER